jgi:hypothetical protein
MGHTQDGGGGAGSTKSEGGGGAWSAISFIADFLLIDFLGTGSCYIVQAGLELAILLPQPPEC